MKSWLDEELGRISTSVEMNSLKNSRHENTLTGLYSKVNTLKEDLGQMQRGFKESVEKLSIQGLHTAYQ